MKAETCAVRDILPGDIADLARLHAEAFPFEPWDRDSLARLIAMPAMLQDWEFTKVQMAD